MAGPLDLLLQSSAQLFAGACTPELQESVEAGEWPTKLWRAIEDNELPLALVPESAGGIGLGWPEAVAVLRLAGSFAIPVPLAETMLATRLLADAGFDPSLSGTWAGDGQDPNGAPWILAPFGFEPDVEHAAITIRPGAGGDSILFGSALRVPWCQAQGRVVLVAEDGGGPLSAVRVAVDSSNVLPRASASGEPVGDLVFEDQSVPAADVKRLPGALDLETLIARLALARSAQMAGAMERILDLTIEHARERQQFGRPIARFQAVQQQVAELAAEVAVVGAAVDAAAVSFERDETSRASRLAVASVKSRAGEAASKVTAIAHQVHGAIGFTREHVLHRFTRRLWTWRDEAGNDREWQERIGQRVAEAGANGLWDLLCE